MRSHIIQALIAVICAMAYTHTAVAEDKVKMRKCKSVKVAARASNKVYNVWKSIEHGKRAKPKKTKFGTFALLEHFYGGDEFGGLAALFKYNGRCVLAWKGTDFKDMRDIKADLFSLAGSTCKGFGGAKDKVVGNCGLGFRKQHDSIIKAGLFEKLKEHLKTSCKGKKLLITGHSLGGALASLFSATLSVSAPKLSKRSLTVTFGAPKVFGVKDADRFHKALKKRVLRFVSYGDPVTSLPRAQITKSKHFGNAIFLTTEGFIFKDPAYVAKKQNFSASWKPGASANHKMTKYIEQVTQCR